MKEQDQGKYITHTSGLPVRIPPYLRMEIGKGNPDANIQLEAMRKDPYVSQRNPEDTLPANMQENIRLRRIAGGAAKELRSQAEEWGIERYTVVVHGSLAKGIVRSPSNQDRSDIDIDLVIDSPNISRADRNRVRETLRLTNDEPRIDSYVWNMDEIRRTVGEYARYYLRSATYPVVNKGGLWQEILWTGIESQRFLNLHNLVRKKVRRILPMIIDGQIDQVLDSIDTQTAIGTETYRYLENIGILNTSSESAEQKAWKIYSLLKQQDKKPDSHIVQKTEARKQWVW